MYVSNTVSFQTSKNDVILNTIVILVICSRVVSKNLVQKYVKKMNEQKNLLIFIVF